MINELKKSIPLLAILENTGYGILIVDKNGKIIFLNSQIEKVFGFSKEELLGQSVEMLLPKFSQKNHRRLRADFMLSPATRNMGEGRDLVGLRKDGSLIPIEIGLNPSKFEDHLVVVASVVDITKRKQLEKEVLKYTEKLERRNESLKNFAHVLSHDLKGPLANVKMACDLMIETAPRMTENELQKFLQRIERTVFRALKMADGLLQYSDVSHQDKIFEPTNLSRIVQEILEDLRELINKKQASIKIGELCSIIANPTMIRQLIQNLVTNALKFHVPEKPSKINISFIPFSKRHPFHQLIIEDNGIGFDEKKLPFLLTPFKRLHSQRKYEGFGIGLATCKRIAEYHGGSISAKSAPNQGSKFIVTLPQNPPLE